VSVALGELRCGRIVWATVRDHNGFCKRRPAIVMTPTKEIAARSLLVLMSITTTFPHPTPANCVELPWNSDPRRVSTGLGRRSAAVVTWLETISADEVDAVIGDVPAKVMNRIQALLRELNQGGPE
jgi:mRNA-degrading endonuclease toxin of MazEF toxin-antitoxin module